MFAPTLKTPDSIRSAWRCVVLLVLLGFPLACDQTPTAPPAATRPRVETSLLPSPSFSTLSLFDGSHYLGLDLNYAVQFQYGTAAKAVLVSNHLYGWRAQVGTQLYPIDMQRAVHDLYGWDYNLAAVGVGPYDWRAVNFWAFQTAYPYAVLPVMLVASDYFYNVAAVQQGLTNLESVLVATRTWYAQAMTTYGGPSKTFRLLQPLVVFKPSSWNAVQWNYIANGLWNVSLVDAAVQEYSNSYLSGFTYPPYGVRLMLIPFSGSSTSVSGLGDFYAYWWAGIAPPEASGVTCPATGALSSVCAAAAYWVGHELGRTLGLQECPAANPGLCQYSIMFDYPGYLSPRLGNPFLTQDQISALSGTGYFF